LQSRGSGDARNTGGGQAVKIRMEEMEKSPFCAGLERYKQKITTYVGRDLYVMKRSDFSIELKDFPAIEEVDIENVKQPSHLVQF